MRRRPSSKNLGRKAPRSDEGKMSDLRQGDPVVAIAVGDVHLSHKAPVARSAEKDWYAAMERPLDQVRELAVRHDVPIVYVGDIFHHWNSPPELINFALRNLPRGFAVPGQHDLPHHRYEDVFRSAFGTLVRAGHLEMIPPGVPISLGPLVLYGFPWGTEIVPCPDPAQTFVTRIAVCHRYIWTKSTGYEGAPEDGHLSEVRKLLKGYDAAIFGDNHKGFLSRAFVRPDNAINFMNCGAVMRRNSDEKDYQPMVGLIHSSGEIEPYPLVVQDDVFLQMDEIVARIMESHPGIEKFVEELENLNEATLDFYEAVKKFMAGSHVSDSVRKIVLNAMEERK